MAVKHGQQQSTLSKKLAQHAMERRRLNITLRDKVKNSVIRYKTKVKDIIEKITEAYGDGQGTYSKEK